MTTYRYRTSDLLDRFIEFRDLLRRDDDLSRCALFHITKDLLIKKPNNCKYFTIIYKDIECPLILDGYRMSKDDLFKSEDGIGLIMRTVKDFLNEYSKDLHKAYVDLKHNIRHVTTL
jgi:hypothetical protein